ncbi:MAG: choice-of-anchor B family protein [Gemmatimonadota bacterium]
MPRHGRTLGVGAALWLASVANGGAQDQFGRAVAVAGDHVIVVKPTVGRGPAMLYVFSRDGSERERLTVARSARTGEGVSPSLSAQSGAFVVGSGDPENRLAGHMFRRGAGGQWAWDTSPAIAPAPATGGPALDFAGILRILQPPSRVVALDGDRLLAGVVGAPGGERGVRVLEKNAEGTWAPVALLAAPEGPDARFGSALWLNGDEAWVGAPGFEGTGAVFRFVRQANGAWTQDAVLRGETLPPGSRMGEALVLAGSRLVAGAPGADGSRGLVLVFSPTSVGGWAEVQRLEGEAPGDAFGSALAYGARELWVGAPQRDARAGAVYRWGDGEDGLVALGPLPLGAAQAGDLVGIALALTDEIGVVGAPGAVGGVGRAAVLQRRNGAQWSIERWVEPLGRLASARDGEVPCVEGAAAGFKCENVDLLSFVSLQDLGAHPGERVSDLWGWTDPQTGREYALVGRTAGAAIVDVTDAGAPRFLGLVPGNPSGARDLKVYRDHLFFTGDGAGEHGLVVFDLTRIRDLDATAPTTVAPDTVYHGIASAHNLVIDTGSGYAFPVGASGGGETCGGGLHMVDIRDPKAPVFAGCYTDTEGLIWQGRTHDAQCVVYDGPDEPHRGRQICFASNETAIRIVDVTDKANPTPIGVATYPGRAYVHQGWLSDDQRYFYMNDELDELVGTAPRTRTYVWDVSELDDPILLRTVDGPDTSTDHNLFVKGDRMYQANYQAGFRVFDLSDPENPVEIGWFDTTPYEGNPPGFVGAWTAYPFFASGTVIVSSMNEGLFLLRPRGRPLIP